MGEKRREVGKKGRVWGRMGGVGGRKGGCGGEGKKGGGVGEGKKGGCGGREEGEVWGKKGRVWGKKGRCGGKKGRCGERKGGVGEEREVWGRKGRCGEEKESVGKNRRGRGGKRGGAWEKREGRWIKGGGTLEKREEGEKRGRGREGRGEVETGHGFVVGLVRTCLGSGRVQITSRSVAGWCESNAIGVVHQVTVTLLLGMTKREKSHKGPLSTPPDANKSAEDMVKALKLLQDVTTKEDFSKYEKMVLPLLPRKRKGKNSGKRSFGVNAKKKKT